MGSFIISSLTYDGAGHVTHYNQAGPVTVAPVAAAVAVAAALTVAAEHRAAAAAKAKQRLVPSH